MEEKIGYLDSLRGIAALVVVICHFVTSFYPTFYNVDTSFTRLEFLLRETPLNIFYNGGFAVYVFFVLSGYVLTYKYFQKKDDMIIVGGAVRRYFRLLGPILISILASYLLLSFGLMYNEQAGSIIGSDWFSNFYPFNPNLKNALWQAFHDILLVGVYGNSSYNPVLWTMNVEFIGSFLIFSLALLITKVKNSYLLYLLALFFTINTYYMCFIFGMFLADTYNSEKKDLFRINNKNVSAFILLAGLFLGSYIQNSNNPVYQIMTLNILPENRNFYCSIGAALLLLGLLNLKNLQEILSHRALVFVGSLSFSLYVVHWLVITSYSSWQFIQLAPYMPYFSAFLLTFLLSTVLIFSLSYLMYYFVDLNSIKLSKSFYNMLNPKVSISLEHKPANTAKGEGEIN